MSLLRASAIAHVRMGFLFLVFATLVLPLRASVCTRTSVGLTPLIDGAGLYPTGSNVLTGSRLATGQAAGDELATRQRVVVLSIGMSNASSEFGAFRTLVHGDAHGTVLPDADVHPRVKVVNAAFGGCVTSCWAHSNCERDCWGDLQNELTRAKIPAADVGVVWLKAVNYSTPTEDRVAWRNVLTADLRLVLQEIASRFPNARQVFVSSRIYAGYATSTQNPEPHAYESGWAVRDLMADASLPIWSAWGPYLWADGLIPRRDGLTWSCADFETDGTHPSTSGDQKVANQLLAFFKRDPATAMWFLRFPIAVHSISPTSGPAAGGTRIGIAGTNFVAGATVTIGGVTATEVTVENASLITATTPAGSGSAEVVVTNPNGNNGKALDVFHFGTANQPPGVNAGADITIMLPASATLNGTVSDDGLPNPPGAVSVGWSQVSGPGTVAFGDPSDVSTSASVPAEGTYVLRLTANDGELIVSDTVTITTTGTNRAPVATGQTITMAHDTAKAIQLMASDPDSDPLTFTILAPPSHGVLSGIRPDVVYTPERDYSGGDSFTFSASDGTVDSNVATVSIAVVNEPPVANAQAVTAPENMPTPVTLTGADPESDPLTFAIVTGPSHGALTGTPPQVIYTPVADYNGADSFTFAADDGKSESRATVSITVTPPNVSLTVSTSGSGAGVVTSSPAGIVCPSTCTNSFARGTVVTVTATPNGGSMFSGWGEVCTGTGACVIAMDDAKQLSAMFVVSSRDLIETTISSPPGLAAPGGSFAVSDTVRNQGAVTAGTSTTRFYFSPDAVKSPGDILLSGSRTVASLTAGLDSSGATTVVIPTTTALGSYFLLACADDKGVVVEINETNNCGAASTTVQVTRPDLVETAITNPPTMLVPGSRFTLTDTVQNQGLIVSAASTVRYYLSRDNTISGDDVRFGDTRTVTTVAASATATGSRTVTVPNSIPLGTYYLIGCADDTRVVIETVESNNCLASNSLVLVGWPDLITTSVGNQPARIAPGAAFMVTDTTGNQGQITAAPSVTRYYLSTNSARDAGDVLLGGTRSILSLEAGTDSTGTRSVTVPATAPPGIYFVLACADDSIKVSENDETNNCAASPMTTQVGLPDLIEIGLNDPPPSATVGSTIAVTDTVQNQGVTDAGSSTTRFYLSVDLVKDSSDVLLTPTRPIGVLGHGLVSTGTKSVKIPSTASAGVYYLLACADDLQQRIEADETNNCRGSITTIIIKP